jgi:hypothetical protein
MVATWAEKEYRNLARIHAAGIPCPAPLILRQHVMVMELVGRWPLFAPLRKGALFSLCFGFFKKKSSFLILNLISLYKNLLLDLPFVLLFVFYEVSGKDGWAAPRLKDALISAERARLCYVQVLKAMRSMYIDCRLVHADLSPYNILYTSGKCVIIGACERGVGGCCCLLAGCVLCGPFSIYFAKYLSLQKKKKKKKKKKI